MKKCVNKTAAFILAAAMVLTLTACGKTGTEQEESIPATAGQEESSREEESSQPSEAEATEPSEEPEETPELEDPYGLGIPISGINWDAAIYDFSGDRMEDGWPSIYQNLAQTVNLVYNVWSEYGWHKDTNGQDASFLDVIAEAELVNKEVWENYDTRFYTEMYDILAPKAEAPFQIDSETKALMARMDGLTMEQLAQIMEGQLFQAFNGDDYMVIHNNDLVEFNNRQMAAANNIPADNPDGYTPEEELIASILGVSVEEYREMSAEFDAMLEAYGDSVDPVTELNFTDQYNYDEEYAKARNMTVDQYYAVLPTVQQIASNALATGSTELEHVRAASKMLYEYVKSGTYGFEANYDSPYGLIVSGHYSCAGTTAAMLMVLDAMGYSTSDKNPAWVNPKMWTHQWVQITMDGQLGWADCMGGIADYGEYPFSCKKPNATYTDPDTGETMWIDWSQP